MARDSDIPTKHLAVRRESCVKKYSKEFFFINFHYFARMFAVTMKYVKLKKNVNYIYC